MITDYETAGKWILGPNRCSCHCHHLTVIFALPHHNDEASEGRMSSGKSQMYIYIYILNIYVYIYTYTYMYIYTLMVRVSAPNPSENSSARPSKVILWSKKQQWQPRKKSRNTRRFLSSFRSAVCKNLCPLVCSSLITRQNLSVQRKLH